jgi:hypothetical protein
MLSKSQLARIFGIGLVGYIAIIAAIIFGTSLIFPDKIKEIFDMSVDTFIQMSFIYFISAGIVTAPLMALSAWIILGIRAQKR